MAADARPSVAEAIRKLARPRHDEEAWRILYTQLWPFVMTVNYRLLNGLRDLAEDASQDVMIRLARYCPFDKLEKEDAFRAYVRTVCRNVARTYVQRIAGRREVRLEEAQGEALTAQETADEVLLTQELLGVARDKLDRDERKLLALLVGGFKPEDIAEVMDITANNVHVRVHRLRRKLGNLLPDNLLGRRRPDSGRV